MRARIIGKRRRKKPAEVMTYPYRYDTPLFPLLPHQTDIFRSTLILIGGFLGRVIEKL